MSATKIPTEAELKERLANLELYANLLVNELRAFSGKLPQECTALELSELTRIQVRELHTILSGVSEIEVRP